MTVNQNLTLTRSKSVIGDQIGDDTIVINIDSGAYYSLSKEAGILWSSTEDGPAPCPEELRSQAYHLVMEGILHSDFEVSADNPGKTEDVFTKYTEMADILLADPIHEVDEDGWPRIR